MDPPHPPNAVLTPAPHKIWKGGGCTRGSLLYHSKNRKQLIVANYVLDCTFLYTIAIKSMFFIVFHCLVRYCKHGELATQLKSFVMMLGPYDTCCCCCSCGCCCSRRSSKPDINIHQMTSLQATRQASALQTTYITATCHHYTTCLYLPRYPTNLPRRKFFTWCNFLPILCFHTPLDF